MQKMDISKKDAGVMRRVISIIMAVAITLLGVSILQWLFPTHGWAWFTSIAGWGWIANQWFASIAVGFYIGNLIAKRDVETRQWFSALLFFVHAGLWVTAMYLLLRLVPAVRVQLSDFAGSVPVLTRLAFAAESHAEIIVLVFAFLLLAVAWLSFRRGKFSRRQHWMTQAVAIVPVFVTDVLVFVGLVVGEVSAINSIQ